MGPSPACGLRGEGGSASDCGAGRARLRSSWPPAAGSSPALWRAKCKSGKASKRRVGGEERTYRPSPSSSPRPSDSSPCIHDRRRRGVPVNIPPACHCSATHASRLRRGFNILTVTHRGPSRNVVTRGSLGHHASCIVHRGHMHGARWAGWMPDLQRVGQRRVA